MRSPSIKQKIGCWLNERWRLELVLRLPELARRLGIGPWQWLRNRNESIEAVGDSVICHWRDSSLLTVARVFPKSGGRLLEHAMTDCPFSNSGSRIEAAPQISVIIPISGVDRWPQLKLVIARLDAQADVALEVIVVEHDPDDELRERLPESVRYFHVPRRLGEPFNKCLAMNHGARSAQSPVLAFLDGDCLIPHGQLADIVEKLGLDSGWQAVRPIRFLFLLGETDTRNLIDGEEVETVVEVSEIQQNNPGLFTCVTRDVYWEIGGHDERFEGWGGEDNEFLERLATRSLYPGGYAPTIHLWHEPAPKKASGDRNMDLYREIMRVPVQKRIDDLCSLIAAGRRE